MSGERRERTPLCERRWLPGEYVQTEFCEIMTVEEYFGEDFDDIFPPTEPDCRLENYSEAWGCFDWLEEDDLDDDEIRELLGEAEG